MIYEVYAISSLTKNYIYVGFSTELEVRLNRHNKGLNKTTAPYAPFRLIYSEVVGTSREEARLREKYWKRGTGKRKLRILRDELD
jgi:putative endonuclease